MNQTQRTKWAASATVDELQTAYRQLAHAAAAQKHPIMRSSINSALAIVHKELAKRGRLPLA